MIESNITPPPELVEKWVAEIWHEGTPVQVSASDIHIATQAAHWGDDQRLEACCEYIGGEGKWFHYPEPRLAELRAAMRPPSPLSDKEQALKKLEEMQNGWIADQGEFSLIRAALEQLPEGPAVTPDDARGLGSVADSVEATDEQIQTLAQALSAEADAQGDHGRCWWVCRRCWCPPAACVCSAC